MRRCDFLKSHRRHFGLVCGLGRQWLECLNVDYGTFFWNDTFLFTIGLNAVRKWDAVEALRETLDEGTVSFEFVELLAEVHEALDVLLLELLLGSGLLPLLGHMSVELGAKTRCFDHRLEHSEIFRVLSLLRKQSLV